MFGKVNFLLGDKFIIIVQLEGPILGWDVAVREGVKG